MSGRILVPLDGSRHAFKALDYACDFAERQDAELVLLHVVARPEVPESVRQFVATEYPDEQTRSAEEQRLAEYVLAAPEKRELVPPFPEGGRAGPPGWLYDEILERVILGRAEEQARGKGIRVARKAVEHGDPAECIVDTAARQQANLIVMGTRGLTDFGGLLMGSVAHKVTHSAPCTVITVR